MDHPTEPTPTHSSRITLEQPIPNETLPEKTQSFYEEHHRLEKGGTVTLDVHNKELIHADDPFFSEVEAMTGERLTPVAIIGVAPSRKVARPIDRFIVLDTALSKRYAAPYVLLKEENGEPVVKGVWAHKPAVVGRNLKHENRFHHSEYVSASHFSVQLSAKGLEVTDLHSTNGTSVTGFIVRDFGSEQEVFRRQAVVASFTEEFGKRAQHLIGFNERRSGQAPYGTFEGYAVIGRDSPTVRGGVYGTLKPNSEFVVVDHKSLQVEALDRELQMRTAAVKHDDVKQLLESVSRLTAEHMRYDLAKTEALCRPYYDAHGIIALSEFIDAGVGVCRQQALLAATLTETLIEEGKLRGTVHVERNFDREAHGAHAWAVWGGAGVDDIIIDPAQGFVGTREQAKGLGRWRYYIDASRRS